MNYELWVETASDYEELKENLAKRGYSNLPLGASFSLDLEGYTKAPTANTSGQKTKKTMLRRKESL
jgi:hypothetical protein